MGDLAVSPARKGVNGRLLHDGQPIKAPFIDDREAQERLWTASERLAGLAAQDRVGAGSERQQADRPDWHVEQTASWARLERWRMAWGEGGR